jgi:hypothetical protein
MTYDDIKAKFDRLGNEGQTGFSVQVYSFGCWYPGMVTKVGKKNVQVRYVTSGGERTKTFAPGYIAPEGTFKLAVRGQPQPGSKELDDMGLCPMTPGTAAYWAGKVPCTGQHCERDCDFDPNEVR